MSDYKSTAQRLAEIAELAQNLAKEAEHLPVEDVTEFETRLDEAEGSITRLDELGDDHQNQIEELSERLDTLESREYAIDEDEYSDFKTSVEDDLEDHQKTINALRDQVVSLEIEKDAMLARLAVLEGLLNVQPANQPTPDGLEAL